MSQIMLENISTRQLKDVLVCSLVDFEGIRGSPIRLRQMVPVNTKTYVVHVLKSLRIVQSSGSNIMTLALLSLNETICFFFPLSVISERSPKQVH